MQTDRGYISARDNVLIERALAGQWIDEDELSIHGLDELKRRSRERDANLTLRQLVDKAFELKGKHMRAVRARYAQRALDHQDAHTLSPRQVEVLTSFVEQGQ